VPERDEERGDPGVPGDPGLDIEQPPLLVAYLRASGRIAPTEAVRIRRLEGGVSNRTVLVQRADGESWVIKQALSRLRVAEDWFCSPERIHREALGMRWLAELTPPGSVPPLIWEDREENVLAMGAVPEPHANWKELLLRDGAALGHVDEFGRLLGTIHRRGWERRGELAAEFGDRSFFESLRVEPYYRYPAARIAAAAPFLQKLIEEGHASSLTLVHGDFSPKNILVSRGHLVLLDHEVMHIGDPAFDVGFATAHLLSKAHYHGERGGEFLAATQRFWNSYAAALGAVPWARSVEPRAVRHALGCLLARVAGRSPLEYLGEAQRRRQREATVAMMSRPPETMAILVEEWGRQLEDANVGH
jgi:aminoglycoside phosphotransferase (APT) family kinase protein